MKTRELLLGDWKNAVTGDDDVCRPAALAQRALTRHELRSLVEGDLVRDWNLGCSDGIVFAHTTAIPAD